jgi:hypothetical protein
MSRVVSRSRAVLGMSVRCRNVPAGPVKVPMLMRYSSRRMAGQVWPVWFSATRTSREGEPAEDDVGADALFEPVVDGAQVKDRFHVAPASLDFQELLVAGGNVLGGHGRGRRCAAGTCRRGSPRPSPWPCRCAAGRRG